MATLYTPTATKQLDTQTKRAPGSSVSPVLMMAVVPYVLAGTEVANDILNIVKLPPGATVIPHLCKVVCDDPGTSLTLQFGDTLASTPDVDKYSGTLDISAGGKFDLVEGAAVGALAPAALTDEAWVTAKVIAANTLTADADVVFYIAYAAVA